MTNPENLTKEEILEKIKLLEHSILICCIRSGPLYCINRVKRVKVLKSYLENLPMAI